MKSLILIVLISTYYSLSYAQIQQGDWTLGGNLGANATKSEQGRSRQFNASFNAGGGYFILDGLNIGLNTNTHFFRVKHDGNLRYRGNSLKFGPTVSYYLMLSDKTYWINQIEYSRGIDRYAYNNVDYATGGGDEPLESITLTKSTTSSIEVATGMGYFINRIWGLQATLYYTPYEWFNTGNYSDQSSSLRFNVGLRYFISVRMGNE